MMTAAAAGAPAKKRDKELPARRPAIVASVCCAALAGLDSLARKYRGTHAHLLSWVASIVSHSAHALCQAAYSFLASHIERDDETRGLLDSWLTFDFITA